jgi:hypothetical protein
MYAISNIKLDVTYINGAIRLENGPRGRRAFVSGLDAKALNMVVTNQVTQGRAGTDDDGTALTFIPSKWSTSGTSNTTTHELAHNFLGHAVQKYEGPWSYGMKEAEVGFKLTIESAGWSITGFRTGVEPRVYAVPVSPTQPAKK